MFSRADRPDHEDDLVDADDVAADDSSCSHEVHEKRFFNEPLYCQRYQFVMDLLAEDRWKRHLRRVRNAYVILILSGKQSTH